MGRATRQILLLAVPTDPADPVEPADPADPVETWWVDSPHRRRPVPMAVPASVTEKGISCGNDPLPALWKGCGTS
jgi:hypothetical protein